MNMMGSGLWGLGFTVVIARSRKILKRFAATPMRRSHYLLSFMLSRLVFLVLEVAAVIVFATAGFWFYGARLVAERRFDHRARWLHFFRHRIARGCSADDDRRRVGLDELHHAADVVAFGHVLLVGTISTNPATVHPGAAVNRTQQRAPRIDERRRDAVVQLDSDRHTAGVVRSQFRGCVEDFPVAISDALGSHGEGFGDAAGTAFGSTTFKLLRTKSHAGASCFNCLSGPNNVNTTTRCPTSAQ